ncbi:hypothetical protein [Streptomyces sp. NBC_01190]|nr:hypothetical protein OG519_19835 [Streptomyces sp. NBC_01190]
MNSQVLHRPVEFADYVSEQFAKTLEKLGLRQSVGRIGAWSHPVKASP